MSRPARAGNKFQNRQQEVHDIPFDDNIAKAKFVLFRVQFPSSRKRDKAANTSKAPSAT
ncbi:hypothetical protein PISMIDRAFT_690887 [Pisolithus microcarpus 441]|uniref:Unplaced genomic scaffold scaffold_801, whole genome shotgun sequence n=1 Tax=Pisolithus microcarpus 441 TaxID=765257 RepID=A0A0C9Y0D1_9AGAM|nr:hypothetical protein PISMIDRAFT_690887 [Pisolithus microcarpus 441]